MFYTPDFQVIPYQLFVVCEILLQYILRLVLKDLSVTRALYYWYAIPHLTPSKTNTVLNLFFRSNCFKNLGGLRLLYVSGINSIFTVSFSVTLPFYMNLDAPCNTHSVIFYWLGTN